MKNDPRHTILNAACGSSQARLTESRRRARRPALTGSTVLVRAIPLASGFRLNELAEPRPAARTYRGGAALLVCIFVMAMTAAVVVAVVDGMTLQMTSLRHTTNYERASYLAGAGVYHALAELEADSTWRAGVPNTEFPIGSGRFYSATVVDGTAGTVVITGSGTAGGVTRKLELTVELGG